ncbi:MAG: penicillin-binding protein 2, partial [Armatimonadetes bacterium]|nr:penicillin-binding protein 2 [Armatimonadota bacterium]
VIDPENRRTERVRAAPLGTIHLAPDALRTLRDALEAVVLRGTGRGVALPGLTIAGKTGSAENPRGQPHAWFTAYAPAEAPRVAVAVLVEHGRRGALAAGPIAKAVLAAAFGIPLEPEAREATR